MHLTAYAIKCIKSGMQDSVGTDEFSAWFAALSERDAEAVTRAVTMLESIGAEQPRVTAIEGFARFAKLTKASDLKLRELAVEGTALRVLFAIEADERAVLLYGYDAASEGGDRGIPPAAHAMVAANVYRLYLASRPGAV